MPKRKLISLLRKPSSQKDERLVSSSDDESLIKRIRPDLLCTDSNDQILFDFVFEQANLAVDEDNEQNGNISEGSTLSLPVSNEANINSINIDENQYDDYQNFMSSFQFFSDEESYESDSQDDVLQSSDIKKEEKISKRKKKWERRYQSLKLQERTWHEQSLCAYFDEMKVRPQKISDNVRVLAYYVKNLECVFMDHPSSVPIVGYVRIILLAGKASIQGYELQLNKPVIVFSQKQTGILSVTSHYCEEETICNDLQSKMTHYLFGVPESQVRDYIKNNMKYSSTVFIIQNITLPPTLQFLQLHSSYATSFEPRNKAIITHPLKTRYTGFTEKEENILKFGPEYEEIFSTIHRHLLKINGRKPGEKEKESIDSILLTSLEDNLENAPTSQTITGFRILITGPRKAGKSTMLRYLVNSFLNKYPEVYYLDTDPGQSEFTPSGGISLVKLTSPVFGPPYSHIRTPIKMTFTGTITPETSPPMHMKSISRMIKFFNSHYSNSLLVVNTIGWMTGVGKMINDHIKKTLLPAVEIELTSTLNALNISIDGSLLKCTVGFERNAATSTKQGDNRPADLRDWALLAYFGRCQPYYLQPESLNAFRPVCICWDKIAVYNFNKRLMYNRYYEALNGSVVALCHVEESCMLTPTNPNYPFTIEEEPDNDCLGYGFVRAVDEEHHLLYVITPLSCNSLNYRVNAILSGNIIIPRDVIYEQRIFNVELEYTDGSKEGKTELRKPITKRSRGHSSKDRIY